MVSNDERPTCGSTYGGESCTSNARSSSSSPPTITPKRMTVKYLEESHVPGLSYGTTDPYNGIPGYEMIQR